MLYNVKDFYQIVSVKQHRPNLVHMEMNSKEMERVTAHTVTQLQAIDVTMFAFDVSCLIEYTKQLEEKLREYGEVFEIKTDNTE